MAVRQRRWGSRSCKPVPSPACFLPSPARGRGAGVRAGACQARRASLRSHARPHPNPLPQAGEGARPWQFAQSGASRAVCGAGQFLKGATLANRPDPRCLARHRP
ncbi:hypothetical protein CBM2600_A10272 [Cupriavidus taiwanensis]|nr:hypothetical protein CBM2600_A10272 [Cupriavidus taiwanensis]